MLQTSARPQLERSIPAPRIARVAHPSDTLRIELLSFEDYPKWDELVEKSPHGTVFHYSWWLEATGYDFQILVCRDGSGEVIAGIPLPWKKRFGLTLFHSPVLTPYLGPIFDISGAPHLSDKLYTMRRVGEALARAIRGFDSLSYVVGASAPDLQGFLWAGFRAELAYTFRFDAGTTADEVLGQMTRTRRQKLARAADEALSLDRGNYIDVLMELNRETFARQGLPLPYPQSVVRRLWAAAKARGNAEIYVSRAKSGQFVAACLTVHDPRASYQIVSGIRSEMRDSSAGFLVTWQAIQDGLQAGRAYDFEGSRIRGVEQFLRRWGSMAKPVWNLLKAGSFRGQVAQTLLQRRMRPK